MNFKKASLDYLSIIMIVYTGTWSRYISMTVPNIIKCVSEYSDLKPILFYLPVLPLITGYLLH